MTQHGRQIGAKDRIGRGVAPYSDFSRNDFALYNRKYRFNWDSPIGFAPWNPHLSWVGGSVLFQSSDRGWKPISPDLTLNIKAHQQPAGGPLALDVSSAEFSDTILDIEGSTVRAGEIWVGTDDGLVQVTTDDGKHWSRVEPKDVGPYGRVETVAPASFDPATAYANVDRHRSGDYAPYLFVTHNYGKTWTKIVNGLATDQPDQYVRTVRPDIHNRNLVYAGTEQGLWISYDGGSSWSSFQMNLPTVSVRDIRIQPTFDDLVIATHGRDLWILDDLHAIQYLPQARARGAMLFPVRTAYQYLSHDNDEGLYTRFSGTNPPTGAILTFYQAAPQAKAPGIEILDARGRVIRHIKPQPPKKKGATAEAPPENPFRPGAGPGVTNEAGFNRVVWDFRTDGVPQWMGAARPQYRGAQTGPAVVPGTYTARIVIDGRTYSQSFAVKADPQSPYTQADYVAANAFATKYSRISGQIDTILNHLDAQKKALSAAEKLHPAGVSGNDMALLPELNGAMTERNAIFALFTADYHNDEDSIQRPGALREDIPGGYGVSVPTAQTLEYAARYDKAYRSAVARYNNYVRVWLVPLSKELKLDGGQPVDGAAPVSP